MESSQNASISRRSFLQGGAAAGAALGLGMLACGVAYADEDAAPEEGAFSPESVTETIDTDVVVVGCGISGIVAAVQAAELGLGVTVLEVMPVIDLSGASGCFGVGSTAQQEQGIEIAIPEIVDHISTFFNYRVNNLFWQDMLGNSGDNIDWLAANGTRFSGEIDCDENAGGKFRGYHRLDGKHSLGETLITPMAETLATYPNTQILFETRGRELITNGDKVVGVYATKADDSVIQINAKAVILASGSVGGNYELVASLVTGLPLGRWTCGGKLTNVGDGLQMAQKLGACPTVSERAVLGKHIVNVPDDSIVNIGRIPNGLWVAETGERFCNEGCNDINTRLSINASLAQRESYCIIDADIINAAAETYLDGLTILTNFAEEGNSEVFMADTLEEVAEQAGIDKDVLVAQVEQYNGFCEAGTDEVYMKDPKYLSKIATPPFFALRQSIKGHCIIGAMEVDRDMRVLRQGRVPIEGLYAVGNDSNMNYKETCTIEVAGTCFCNCVNSGRTAAKHIAANL